MRLRVGPGLDRDADRRLARRQRLALGEPALERDHDRAVLRRRRIVGEKRPTRPRRSPRAAITASDARLRRRAAPTWMPHSTFPRPRQRPARSSSPGLTGLVQGRQPIEGKPLATRGWRGRPASSMYFEHVARAPADQRIDLDPLALRLEQRQARARRALEALAAGYPRVEPFHRLGERADLADLAAAVRIAGEQEFLRVLGRQNVSAFGVGHDHVRELQASGRARRDRRAFRGNAGRYRRRSPASRRRSARPCAGAPRRRRRSSRPARCGRDRDPRSRASTARTP